MNATTTVTQAKTTAGASTGKPAASVYRSTTRPVKDLLVSITILSAGTVAIVAGAIGAVVTGTN